LALGRIFAVGRRLFLESLFQSFDWTFCEFFSMRRGLERPHGRWVSELGFCAASFVFLWAENGTEHVPGFVLGLSVQHETYLYVGAHFAKLTQEIT
jgi:hypothetical protein